MSFKNVPLGFGVQNAPDFSKAMLEWTRGTLLGCENVLKLVCSGGCCTP